MDPPKSSTTIRITTPLGHASQFANSPMTVIELKGRKNHEKGEHYLQLSLTALRELANLLENDRLSAADQATYNRAYTVGQRQYDEARNIRDQLLTQKKTFRKFIVNLFYRRGESDAHRFYKVSYEAYSSIRRTSEDLARRLLPNKSDILTSGSPGESAQGDISVCEESPCEVVEGSFSVNDLPPDETIRGINVEVHGEQEEQEAFETFNRIAKSQQADEEDDDDDDQTIKPRPSQSRPSSPSSICTIIWNNYHITQSVVSFDSETSGSTLNVGVDKAAGSSSDWQPDTNQPLFQ
ncbi:hypothetical protein DEU56DRAFT_796059 [Suillus clintonianus]|uniref:uncharacterized protein n=1 Tax=Suillus clintonianus TaxID=1904413 RepID=UPI001B8708AA|nr:uncharacterized protein DEU56DRAFT_796059 [Suillus clintonianus]KAG2141278.1 hypothetical protein DEU56DRAFT_796059 [Suillus clintonianus]